MMRSAALSGLLLAASCHAPSTYEDLAPLVEPTPTSPEDTPADSNPAAPAQPNSPSRGFKRPSWVDADGDCQSTRIEVLILENMGELVFEDERHCKVIRGTWRCPYTGQVFHDAKDLHIDHMVPLKNAWDSGASGWTDERWRQYANDLEHPEHLIAVAARANMSKGDRGPDEWLPPLAEYRCTYVRDWAAIKARWGLGATATEAEFIDRALALCDAGEVPPLPQKVSKGGRAPSNEHPTESSSPANHCCRVCRKGKACGNGCIPRYNSCSKEPGCACDG